MGKIKKNPRNIPATQADVKKARKLGERYGCDLAFTVFFTAILDKGFIPREEMTKFWAACLYVSDSFAKNYATIYEQQKVLEEEYGIRFSKLEV